MHRLVQEEVRQYYEDNYPIKIALPDHLKLMLKTIQKHPDSLHLNSIQKHIAHMRGDLCDELAEQTSDTEIAIKTMRLT